MHFEALRINQPSGREVYAFAATADTILKIADIPRIGRLEDGRLVGYQRPEAAKHIAEIRRYIEGNDAVLPNTIVIAFDNRIEFSPHNGKNGVTPSQYGVLNILEVEDGAKRPGFVVDGQQRLAAIASCRYADFPVFVTAIVAPELDEQRKQFILVNRTKPLPEGIVFELLPEISGVLPQGLSRQRIAAAIVSGLNLQKDSSLYHRVKTPTCPIGYIKDNSVRRLVVNSLSDGALYDLLHEQHVEEKFVSNAIYVISTYWRGVSIVFSEACALPPERSRLTHGVGIIAMGYVMDHIYFNRPITVEWSAETIASRLVPLSKYCAWTEGKWDFGGLDRRRWNELENTDKDIRLLTNYFRRLLQAYDSQSTP